MKGLAGVDFDEAIEDADTGSGSTFPVDVAEGGLHDDCFKRWDGLFAECCGHGMSESREI